MKLEITITPSSMITLKIFASMALGACIGITIIAVNAEVSLLHAMMMGLIGFGALAVMNINK